VPAKGFTSIGIPKEMWEEVKKLIEERYIRAIYGVKNPSEFCKRAISEKIIELRQKIEEEKEKETIATKSEKKVEE